MRNTGKFISKERLEEILKIHQRTQEPLFGVSDTDMQRTCKRVDDAVEELHEAIDQAAIEVGLPVPEKDKDGDVIHYGLLGTGEITEVT